MRSILRAAGAHAKIGRLAASGLRLARAKKGSWRPASWRQAASGKLGHAGEER